jgi:hypothetical protein
VNALPEPFLITREPDDSFADVRVSLGRKGGLGAYLVFRGDPVEVAALLRLASAAADRALPAGRYQDKRRRRPQG